jgi:hypothetical protein
VLISATHTKGRACSRFPNEESSNRSRCGANHNGCSGGCIIDFFKAATITAGICGHSDRGFSSGAEAQPD